MRLTKLAFLAMIPFAAFALGGCAPTSGTGGGRATDGSPSTSSSHTFSLKGPLVVLPIKQGEKKSLDLSVDRGTEFKMGVKLEAQPPKGVKAELSSKSIGAGDKAEFTLTVEVEKDAPLGDQLIKITGTPDKGASTTLDLKVKVEEKK